MNGQGQASPGTAVSHRQGRPPQVQWLLLYATGLLTLFGVVIRFAGQGRISLLLFAAAACSLLVLVSGVKMKRLVSAIFGESQDPQTAPESQQEEARPEEEQNGPARHAYESAPREQHGVQGQPPWAGPPGYPPARHGGLIGPPRHTGPIGPGSPVPDRRPDQGHATDVLDRPEPRGTIPGPPAFGRSTAGQAPWRLPGNAAPSGLAADAARLGDLEVRAASMVGPDHRCDEPAAPRQDAYALGRTPDGQYLIIAVADGVSSSRHSDLGARLAVTTSVRELARMLAAGGMQAIGTQVLYNTVAGTMVGTGRDRKISDDDICTILITAVIPTTPRPDGTRQLWASWIGDVSMWMARGGTLERLTGEDKSGLDRNQLSAVLPFNPDGYQENFYELPLDSRVAFMTDGLSDAFSDVPPVADFFARQWAGPPPHPAAFLTSLCYDAPGQTDDRTAVVVWPGTSRHSRREQF